jgi:hypothetical protein
MTLYDLACSLKLIADAYRVYDYRRRQTEAAKALLNHFGSSSPIGEQLGRIWPEASGRVWLKDEEAECRRCGTPHGAIVCPTCGLPAVTEGSDVEDRP